MSWVEIDAALKRDIASAAEIERLRALIARLHAVIAAHDAPKVELDWITREEAAVMLQLREAWQALGAVWGVDGLCISRPARASRAGCAGTGDGE